MVGHQPDGRSSGWIGSRAQEDPAAAASNGKDCCHPWQAIPAQNNHVVLSHSLNRHSATLCVAFDAQALEHITVACPRTNDRVFWFQLVGCATNTNGDLSDMMI